ncbi:MAG: cell division protein FtsZ [Erythrobacter sp.]
MSINIGPAATEDLRPKITVVGIGGAGGNAIANMISSEIEGVDFIVANTDAQALSQSPAEKRIQLGPDITGGLGAGARPEVGKAAAEETVADIEEALEGVNMVFIAAGMGGGTGTGAAPVIAEAARRKGVLTVGVVTKPFLFEGTRRMRAAEAGIAELQNHVDTLIVIPNQNLFLVAKPETTFKEAFQLADEVLQQGVRSITDLIVNPGLINLDFADIRAVMSEMGKAMMGTGEGEGENRALFAAEQAIANPLLDGVSMQGAKGVIISIIGGEDMTLMELDEAANYIRDLVDEDANIIWGSAFNPDMVNKIRISVVATGIDAAAGADAPPRPSAFEDARAPKRPVLELSDEEEGEDEDQDEAEPFDLSGMQADDEEEESEDDVDEIVDPLAGLRGADDEDGDDLLADADRLTEQNGPVQPNPSGFAGGGMAGGMGGDGAPAGGSTLFERMANLSRSSGSDDEGDEDGEEQALDAGDSDVEVETDKGEAAEDVGVDDEGADDDGGEGDADTPALSIPRFLGRQNNQ